MFASVYVCVCWIITDQLAMTANTGGYYLHEMQGIAALSGRFLKRFGINHAAHPERQFGNAKSGFIWSFIGVD